MDDINENRVLKDVYCIQLLDACVTMFISFLVFEILHIEDMMSILLVSIVHITTFQNFLIK